jgi:hypothetical protein
VPGAADGGVRLASASQGTDREGNPEGHGYISAHMAPVGQTRKVLRRRAFSKKCESVRKGSLTGRSILIVEDEPLFRHAKAQLRVSCVALVGGVSVRQTSALAKTEKT